MEGEEEGNKGEGRVSSSGKGECREEEEEERKIKWDNV